MGRRCRSPSSHSGRRPEGLGHRGPHGPATEGLTIAVQLTVLGSGSAGNATLVTDGQCGVLVDAGLSYRQVMLRLETVGVTPGDVRGIVITHAHGDHTRGAAVFSRKHGVPVYTTESVRTEWGEVELAEWRRLVCGRTHEIGGLAFEPLTVPHDASETVAFRIGTGDGAIGIATDIGVMTSDLVGRFRDCRVLVLESNHATELLEVSPYHPATRARIASSRGHLSNEALAGFIRSHLGATVRCVVLAHLSRVNNVPELAEMTCREALVACGRDDVEVVVTRQDRVARTVDLGQWSDPVPVAAHPRPIVQTSLPFETTAPRRGTHAS